MSATIFALLKNAPHPNAARQAADGALSGQDDAAERHEGLGLLPRPHGRADGRRRGSAIETASFSAHHGYDV